MMPSAWARRNSVQVGLSRASRRMSARTSGSIGGRPGRPVRRYVHFLLTSSRCHRRQADAMASLSDRYDTHPVP